MKLSFVICAIISVAIIHFPAFGQEGAVDPSFDHTTGPNEAVACVTVQPDGKILIGGGFTSYDGVPRNGIVRLNSDGSLDASFDPGSGAGYVGDIKLQPDGKILIGGAFSQVNG